MKLSKKEPSTPSLTVCVETDDGMFTCTVPLPAAKKLSRMTLLDVEKELLKFRDGNYIDIWAGFRKAAARMRDDANVYCDSIGNSPKEDMSRFRKDLREAVAEF